MEEKGSLTHWLITGALTLVFRTAVWRNTSLPVHDEWSCSSWPGLVQKINNEIFPLQSYNTISSVDDWVYSIAHTSLSMHCKMSTTKIILTQFKTNLFFSVIAVSGEWCFFVCVIEKKKSLLHIAQKETYVNLQSMLCILYIYVWSV